MSLSPGPAVAAGLALPLAAGAALQARARATGPARVLAAGAGLAAAAAAVGRYDDAVGHRPEQSTAKGLRGHAAALTEGRLTGGAVKVAGVGGAAVVSAAVAVPGRPVAVAHPRGRSGADRSDGAAALLTRALLVAGSANLANLFDLRPGRALKVVLLPALLLAGAPGREGPSAMLAAAVAGSAAAALPEDLAERGMLGDAGANALGAVLGLAAALRLGPAGRAAACAAVLGLTAASEVVSFSRVIDAVGPLAWVDRLGRLPA